MNLVIFASGSRASRLHAVFAETESAQALSTLACLGSALDTGRADVAVVDVDFCQAGDLRLLAAIISRHGTAVVAYGAGTPEFCRRVAELARHGLCHIVFRGVDDQPGNLKRVVREAAGARLGAGIIEGLSPLLSRGAPMFRGAIAHLFQEPLRFRCAADVAKVAEITRRSLDRTLCALGLEPARTFVLAARVTWAYWSLRSGHTRVSDVSGRLGIAKPERFARHTRLLLGMSPSTVRTQVQPEQFVEMMVRRLQRQPRVGYANALDAHETRVSPHPVGVPAERVFVPDDFRVSA